MTRCGDCMRWRECKARFLGYSKATRQAYGQMCQPCWETRLFAIQVAAWRGAGFGYGIKNLETGEPITREETAALVRDFRLEAEKKHT